jgi:hypothetical protein
MKCPNRNSREWQWCYQRALKTSGLTSKEEIEDRAKEIWVEEGYSDNDDLNEYESDKDAEDLFDAEENTAPKPTQDLSALTQRVKIFLAKQIEILNKKKIENQKYKQKKLKDLQSTIETAEGVESIAIFIGDAYAKALQVKKRFGALLANKDKMDYKEMLSELTAINDFANGYSILDEIDAADIMDYFQMPAGMDTMPGPMTPQKMIAEAISIRDKVKKKVITEAIPMLAKFLVSYKSVLTDGVVNEEIAKMQSDIDEINANTKMSDTRKEKLIKKIQMRLDNFENFDVDEDSMVRFLKMANKDEGLLDFFLSPLISSPDAVIALFAKSVKSQFEFAKQTDIQIRNELSDAFLKYKPSAPGSQDNTEKFNEGIFDIIDIPVYDTDGSIKEYRQEVQFVQQYDRNKYKKAEREMYDKLGPYPQKVGEKATKAEKEKIDAWFTARNKWFAENTVSKPDAEIKDIIEQKVKDMNRGIISQEEHAQWLRRNMVTYQGKTLYIRELSDPADKYMSQKWLAMYNKNGVAINEKGKYHKKLLEVYFNAQLKLPESQRPGYRVPSIPKSDLERLMQNGLKDALVTKFKESIKMQSYDTEFQLGNLSEEDARFLPIYYTQPIDAKDVTLDLVSSVLLFSSMSNKYDALNTIMPEISMMKAVIGARKVPVTNSKGQAVMDAFANKMGFDEYIRQNGESYSAKHFTAFLNMVVYGEMQKAEEFLGGFSFTKLTNSAMSVAAITTLSLDLLKGIANNLQGNIQLAIEAAGGQFFNGGNVRRGKAFVAKNLPGVLADFGKPYPTSLLGQLVESFDAMQGNFKDEYGRKVSMSRLNKLFRTDTLFFNMHFGEYELQTSTMGALLDGIKVVDVKTNEEISLLQAYNVYGVNDIFGKVKIAKKDSNGEVEIDANGEPVYVPYSESYRQDIQARLHGINKYMNGVYNDFDKATIAKLSVGRLALMYRKHVAPGYKRRFKRASMDQEIGTPTEGYYRTFADVLLTDLKQYKYNIIKNWSTYTPFQKAQIRKVLAEIGLILGLATLGFILTQVLVNPDDDERDPLQDNYYYNFLLYETIRMRSETASYLNPIDAIRIFRSPTAMTSTVDRLIKFINQAAPWNITEEYKRESGVWAKGDNKAWAAFLKLMGFSGYNMSPDQAVKAFESTFSK